MRIRYRTARGIIRRIDVRYEHCPTLRCFAPGSHIIRSAAGMSGCSSRSTEELECATRERGCCPSEPLAADRPCYRRRRGVWEQIPEEEDR